MDTEEIRGADESSAIPLKRANWVPDNVTPSITYYEIPPEGKLPGVTIKVSWGLEAGEYSPVKLQWSPK